MALKSLQVQYRRRKRGAGDGIYSYARTSSYRAFIFFRMTAYAMEKVKSLILPSHKTASTAEFSDKNVTISAYRHVSYSPRLRMICASEYPSNARHAVHAATMIMYSVGFFFIMIPKRVLRSPNAAFLTAIRRSRRYSNGFRLRFTHSIDNFNKIYSGSRYLTLFYIFFFALSIKL